MDAQTLTSLHYKGAGILRRMFKYFRLWYLLVRIRHKSLQGVAESVDTDIVNNLLWIEKSRFLEDLSKYRFFLFKRSRQAQNKRIAKDLARIDECLAMSPPLLVQTSAKELGLDTIIPELSGKKSNDAFVRITGHGDAFSDWMNFFFVRLPKEYKWLGPAFLTLCGFIWVYLLLPHIFFGSTFIEWIQSHWPH